MPEVVAPDATPPAAEHNHDVAFGVAFTSDYISRGASGTEHGAAVQPWAELDVGKFYAGYWGSNISVGGVQGWENDFSVGLRHTLGPVSVDVGYVRYVYFDHLLADYGEAYAKATINPVEPLTLGASFFVNPEASSATYAELNAAYALPQNFKISGAVGVINGSTVNLPWNAGISWNPITPLTLDLRYQGGVDANKVVFTLSLASSFSAFKDMMKK